MSANRQFSQTLLPSAPLYVVMRDFGKLGFESVTNPEATREGIIADIASGQIDRVAYVLEVFAREGTSRDITDEIVDAVGHLTAMRTAAE